MFDDPKNKLRWLEQELLEEEFDETDYEKEESEDEDFQPLIRKRNQHISQAIYADEEDFRNREVLFVEKKKKSNRGLKFLAFLELIGILSIVWWWIKWLY